MIQIAVPELQNQLRPRITVFGVGGAGGNAVNNMIRSSLEGVEFVVANSDAQALSSNLAERKLQLGVNLTRGLGAGAKPEVGRASAEEQIDEIMAYLEGTNMAFITGGMGGGTGTGAAPVIARAAREQGILTVGVVTKPFHFEGSHRMRMAEAGISELQQYVDTLIVIPNQNLFRIANEKTTFADAFRMADEVLHSGVRGVTDLMVMPGLINLDFADIRSVMSEMGKAMMGTGEASGEKRSVNAAEAAIANPLLDDVSMKGARGVLINITGGYDMTLFEVDEAANRIREEVDPDANIIFGSTFDEKMEGRMRVSVVATGIDAADVEIRRGSSMPSDGGPAYRSSEQRREAMAAVRSPSFTPGFAAPTAAQSAPVQPRMAAPEQPVTVPAPAATPQQTGTMAAPFSWGLMGQQAKPVTASVQTSMQGNMPTAQEAQQYAPGNSAALQQLLEKARQAEATAKAAEAAFAQQAASQQPQQMSMNIPAQQQQTQNYATQTSAPQADYTQTAEPTKQSSTKRSSSLFARIAGGFSSAQGSTRQPTESAPQAQATSPQPKLGIDPAARPQASLEEEALEIPAFLRRQSN